MAKMPCCYTNARNDNLDSLEMFIFVPVSPVSFPSVGLVSLSGWWTDSASGAIFEQHCVSFPLVVNPRRVVVVVCHVANFIV